MTKTGLQSSFTFLWFCLWLLIPCLSFSQVPAADTATDTIPADSMPVFNVTAAPAFIYASRLRNPFSVASIDQQDIEELQEPTIEPLLNATPGLWMQTGALNTNRISIRGIGHSEPFATTGIKVYLDEIPLTNGAGESSIEDIHPLMLSAVDIWRGPSSAIWGSGLGGMIHLKTNFPQRDFVSSRLQAGSYGRLQADQHVSMRYGSEDQMATSFHYQWLQDDGYRDNNEYRKHSLTWNQLWTESQNIRLTSFMHAIDLKAFIPSSINANDYRDQPHVVAPGWGDVKANEDYVKYIGGLNFSLIKSTDFSYRGSLYGTWFDSDEVRPFNVLNESNFSYGTRHRVSLKAFQNTLLHAGLEYYNEEYNFSTYETLENGTAGEQLSENGEQRTYINGFIQAEIDLTSRWLLFAGLHLAYNKISADALKTNFPVTFYPTAGISYLLGKELLIGASASRGYSNVSLDDILNSSGEIAMDLKNETGWSEELYVQAGNPAVNYVRLGAYNMQIDNTIVTVRFPDDSFEKQNLGQSIHMGVETSYSYDFFESKFNITGSYNYQFNQRGTSGELEDFEGYPKHRTVHSLQYEILKNWHFDIDYSYRSAVKLILAESQAEEPLHLFHAGSTYHLDAGSHWRFSLSGHVHNVFNAKHASMFVINPAAAPVQFPRYFYPGKPRSAYVSLQVLYRFNGE